MIKAGKSRSLCVLCAIAFISLGCSDKGSDQPDLGNVQGTVSLDGKPFVGAIIVFTPEEGRQSTGLTDENGKYELEYLHHSKGAVLGRHTIGFAGPTDETLAVPIPAKYAYGTETGIQEEVKAGDNTLDFSLTSK
jgi:hypothetical protein